MVNFLKQNKTIAFVGGVILLVIFYYSFFKSSDTTPTSLLSTQDQAVDEEIQQLLASLSGLETLELDNSIFSNPVFISLTDFGVEIPPQNVGRRNPFLPFFSSGPSPRSGTILTPGL